MNAIELDFEQAKAKHLLLKSRLRSILYAIEVDEAPVLSHHECGVGKWIYGHTLAAYGHLPEMRELERVPADIHTSARRLVGLLDRLEHQLQSAAPAESPASPPYISLSLVDFQEMLHVNQELDRRIEEQVAETAHATERFNLIARTTQNVVWDWNGEFAGYVGSFSDITEHKAAEDRLRRYFNDLKLKVTFRNLELERQVRALQARLKDGEGAAGRA